MIQLFQTTSNGSDWARWIHANETVWYVNSNYDERTIPKDAGFSWNPKKKKWFTGDKAKAARLAEYSVSLEVRDELMGLKVFQTKSLAESRLARVDVTFPAPPEFEYLPFQQAGINFLVQRNNVLLGDDMGLGKTIQVLGLINFDTTIKTVLVVCPNTIKRNWSNEAAKWLIRSTSIGIADTKNITTPATGYNFVIINYEALRKPEINATLSAVEWDLFVIDEAHNYRNQNTAMYRSVAGGAHGKDEKKKEYVKIRARRNVFLTGTAIVNRPREIWPLLCLLDPEHYNGRTFWYFHKKFCGASYNKYGLDLDGSASPEMIGKLQEELRSSIMIRRLKSDVLTELPPKRRQVVEIEYDENDGAVLAALSAEKAYKAAQDTVEAEAAVELAKANEDEFAYRVAVEKLEGQQKFSFDEMAAVRKQTALAKLPYAFKFIEELLESGQKVVVGCWHHEVIEAITNRWPLESMSIYGKTPQEERQGNVDRFQEVPECKIAVLGIKAAGVGITLTASSTVVMVELPWTPGDLSQLEDRCHRIGQTDSVNVYHLVLKDSIDVSMAKLLIEKQEIADALLNTVRKSEPKTTVATRSLTREKILEEAHSLTPEKIEQIHEAIKRIAELDRDHAMLVNGQGFNKIDGRIGHDLAEMYQLTARQAVLAKKIVKKYSKQLPKELYSIIFEI